MEGQRPDHDPVAGAVLLRTEHQVDQQQGDAHGRRQIPDLLGPFQAAQGPADADEQKDADDDGNNLLLHAARVRRRQNGDAEGTEKESDGLHLIAGAPHGAEDQKDDPFQHDQCAVAKENIGDVRRADMQNHLQHGEDLEHRQIKERGVRLDLAAGLDPVALLLRLLVLCDLFQPEVDAAESEGLLKVDGLDADSLTVHLDAAPRANIADGPASVVIAGQNSMGPGNCRQVHDDVAAPGAANGVLPVGHRQAGFAANVEPGPDFRLFAEGQQGLRTAKQYKKGKHGKDEPHNRQKGRRNHGIVGQRAADGLNELQAVFPSFPG